MWIGCRQMWWMVGFGLWDAVMLWDAVFILFEICKTEITPVFIKVVAECSLTLDIFFIVPYWRSLISY